MSDQAELLNRAANQHGLLVQARRGFEVFLKKSKDTVDAALMVESNGTLIVHYLEYIVTAAPRTVIIDGDLALEYTFIAQHTTEPLWQFYLVETGAHQYALSREPSADAALRICDHKDPHAADHILAGVCMALLASGVMLPRPMDAALSGAPKLG